MPSCPNRPVCQRSGEQGIALVLTLLVVALLTVLIVEYDFRTRLDARSAANFRDDTGAYLLADSVVQAVRGVLHKDYTERAKRPYDANTEEWHNLGVMLPLLLPMLQTTTGGDSSVSVIVADETGKLDLNQLVLDPSLANAAATVKTEKGKLVAQRAGVLQQLLIEEMEMDPVDAAAAVRSVQDWVDEDDNERLDGAESSYYSTLEPPYAARNGPLRTFDELVMIKGFNRELVDKLAPHVTAIWTGTGTTPSPYRGKININTASTALLRALDPNLDDQDVSAIERERDNDPFGAQDMSGTGLKRKITGLDDSTAATLAKLVHYESDFFSVEATGQVGDTKRSVWALLKRGGTGTSTRQSVTQVMAWRVN